MAQCKNLELAGSVLPVSLYVLGFAMVARPKATFHALDFMASYDREPAGEVVP